MESSALKIGELARRSGVSLKAIRFYEAAGVLPPPVRGANGYRFYAPDAMDLLRFIKQAQGLDLTLAEIKEIVTIRRGGRPPCRHVFQLLQEKAAELDQKLSDLTMLRRRVRQSLAAWGRRPLTKAVVCPLFEGSASARQRRSRRR
jgi:DNA-binding transcriptional MerR regulator